MTARELARQILTEVLQGNQRAFTTEDLQFCDLIVDDFLEDQIRQTYSPEGAEERINLIHTGLEYYRVCTSNLKNQA